MDEKIYKTPIFKITYCDQSDVLTGSNEGDGYEEDVFATNK